MHSIMGQQQGASANGTDGGGAVENAWVAALVQTNCERQVARKLEPLSFECYVPVQEEIHLWSDRKKKVQRLIIPNIVFVKTPQPRFDELKRLSFVRGLLSHPGEKEPAKIPEVQMEKLRFMLGQTDVPVELENNVRQLKVGEGKYRVMRGPFRGLEGTIYYMRDGDVRVGVLLQGLGFANVRINKSDIERI